MNVKKELDMLLATKPGLVLKKKQVPVTGDEIFGISDQNVAQGVEQDVAQDVAQHHVQSV